MLVQGQLKKAQFELCTESTKPSASAIPFQIVFTTDTLRVYVSNGTSWIDLNAGSTVPTGTILPWAGSHLAVPSSFSMCDGLTLSRTTEAALFAVIGVTYGAGDGSTTYNKPDLRGRFIRGTDLGAGRDPDAASRTAMNSGGNTGDNVGSIQGDAFASHTHKVGSGNNQAQTGSGKNSLVGTFGSFENSDSAGGNETRPINAYVNFIIKL